MCASYEPRDPVRLCRVPQDSRTTTGVTDPATIVGNVVDLRAFCLVVDLGSLTAAARQLGETKASLSRRISRLEKSVGVMLLRRSSRLVEATEAGTAYRKRLGSVLEMLGAANEAARHGATRPSGTLRVTSGHELNAVLAPIVVSFAAAYPQVKVEMLMTQSVLDFDRDGVDVALRAGRKLADSWLIAKKVIDLDPVLVASPAYVAANRRVRAPADLAGHRLLALSAPSPHGVSLRHRVSGKVFDLTFGRELVSTDLGFLVEIALAGGGIACVPELTVRRELAERRLVRILADHEVPNAALYLLHRAGRLVPPKIVAFRDHVLRGLRSPGALSRVARSAPDRPTSGLRR